MQINVIDLIVTLTNLRIPEDVNLDAVTNAGHLGQWLQFTDLTDGPSNGGTFTVPINVTREQFQIRLAELRAEFAPVPGSEPLTHPHLPSYEQPIA